MEWYTLCITDKSGNEQFRRTVDPTAVQSEIRNLQRHVSQAKANPKAYTFLDAQSAVILLNGSVYKEYEAADIDDDDLLRELGM